MDTPVAHPEASNVADSSRDVELTVCDGMPDGFEAVRMLRAQAYGRPEAGNDDPIDAYSFHVVATARHKRAVGALRVTCRRDGPLESEHAYPVSLLTIFGPKLSACSRLCVDIAYADRRLPLRMMERALIEGLRRGVRLDVSKVRARAIPYYLRLGGYFVKGSLFPFERWNVECGLVAMPAHPLADGPLGRLFQAVTDPVCVDGEPLQSLLTRATAVIRAERAQSARSSSLGR